MLRNLSLRQQNALRLGLIFVLFEIVSAVTVVFLLMLPMAQRASSDLTGLLVLSAQTWSELPPGTRPAFERELWQAHDLLLSPEAPARAEPLSRAGFYLRALASRLTERTGESVPVLASRQDGERWLWTGLPGGGETLWLGFAQRRVGPHPLAALLLTLVAGLLLAAIAAWWLGGHILAPIKRFDAAAAILGRGETPTLLPEQGPRELAGLAHRFNRLSQQIRELLETRTTLLAGLSHDLRTPLARMRLALEMLQRRPDPAWVERLDNDIGEMDQLIGDVLTLARGLSPGAPAALDLATQLDAIADLARSEGNEVLVECPALEVLAPVAPLRRVIGNLIHNACRYAPGHAVDVRAERVGDQCRISVLDRGPGIPSDELDAVFRPFHRIELSRSRGTGGTGLGLAIVRQLAQAQGWRVWLENRAGGGLAAQVQIPLAQADSKHSSAKTA